METKMAKTDWLNDFVTFKLFITSKLMILVYWLGFIGITISGINTIFVQKKGPVFGSYFSFEERFLMGLGILIIGNLIWRIFCEGLIIIFNMNDTLTSINKIIDKRL